MDELQYAIYNENVSNNNNNSNNSQHNKKKHIKIDLYL